MTHFQGFTHETFGFLNDLTEHRDKDWFAANRNRYETHLVGPMKALVKEVAPVLLELNGSFEVAPEVNKTLTRINRDMRFAQGKSPYKDHMLLLFYRSGCKKADAQLFFALQPRQVWQGLYVPPPLLGADAPVGEVVEQRADDLLLLARAAGVGEAYQLGTCQRFGEVDQQLAAGEPASYQRGPHLVIMRTSSPEEVVAAGAAFGSTLAGTLRDLYPLWALYSGEAVTA